VRYVHFTRPSIFIRNKPIFSSVRMLHKDYDRKGSVDKKSLVVSLKGLDARIKYYYATKVTLTLTLTLSLQFRKPQRTPKWKGVLSQPHYPTTVLHRSSLCHLQLHRPATPLLGRNQQVPSQSVQTSNAKSSWNLVCISCHLRPSQRHASQTSPTSNTNTAASQTTEVTTLNV
jgi:hypothetical protein